MNKNDIQTDLPRLETERLLLREVREGDVNALYEYASEPKVTKYVTWEPHESIKDSQAFIDYIIQTNRENKSLTWAIELKREEKMIGTIDLANWNVGHSRAEIAYVLSHKHWGKGYMTEAAYQLLEYGFKTLGLNRIEARILPGNIQSQRVLEKLGMTFEGVARQVLFCKNEFKDLAIYSLLADEYCDVKA